jgi:hypothetical protein
LLLPIQSLSKSLELSIGKGKGRVPWTELQRAQDDYIKAKYLPEKVTLQQYYHLRQEDVHKLLKHWTERQAASEVSPTGDGLPEEREACRWTGSSSIGTSILGSVECWVGSAARGLKVGLLGKGLECLRALGAEGGAGAGCSSKGGWGMLARLLAGVLPGDDLPPPKVSFLRPTSDDSASDGANSEPSCPSLSGESQARRFLLVTFA